MTDNQLSLTETMYLKWHDELVSWCSVMTSDALLSEEIVQEAFLKAMVNAALMEELSEKQRRSWLYRTVKNGFIDHCRKQRFETVSEEVSEMFKGEDTGGIQEYEWRAMFEELSGRESALFQMRYVEGYSSKELSKLFEIPAGTVRYLLSETRKKLRNMLSEGTRYVPGDNTVINTE